MPSRLGVASIVLFWLAVTGYAVHRDVWPRLFGDPPPVVRIDLSDEATQVAQARWTAFRSEKKIGTLTTSLNYLADSNSFRFTSSYFEFKFDVAGLSCRFSDLTTSIDVTRGGELRGQRMRGTLGSVSIAGFPIFEARQGDKVEGLTAAVTGTVRDGYLSGNCVIRSPFGDLDQPIDPVPVPAGQVLNPLMPVNRLGGVRPGLRWVVYEVNPLADALTELGQALVKKHAGTKLANFNRQPGERQALVARVSDRAERLPPLPEGMHEQRATRSVVRPDDPVDCWVIEYRGDQVSARTWVRVLDGKVMRQEATGHGETLLLERED
jgi:hypothetical protein